MINLITTIQLADFICTTTKSMAHGISIIDLEVKMHGTTAIQILRIRVPLGKMTHGGNGKMINGFQWKTSVFMLHKLCRLSLLLANRYGNSEFNKINLYRKKLSFLRIVPVPWIPVPGIISFRKPNFEFNCVLRLFSSENAS